MFTADQLQARIAECAAGRISVNAFEDWFLDHSRNVHSVQDDLLQESSFAIEALFSDLHFEGLSEGAFRSQLKEVGQTFHPFVLRGESPHAMMLRERSAHMFEPALATVGLVVLLLAPANVQLMRPPQEVFVSALEAHASGAETASATALEQLPGKRV